MVQIAILNYPALFGGPRAVAFDAQRLADLR